jgi:phage tail-like protein
MWDWHYARATGAPNARRSGSIVLRDETQTDVVFFHFTNAFLNKITGPDLKAAGNEVAIESAELVVESLTMKLAK